MPVLPANPPTKVEGLPFRGAAVFSAAQRQAETTRLPGRGDTPPWLLIDGLGASLELLEPFARVLGDLKTIRINLSGRKAHQRPSFRFAQVISQHCSALGKGVVDILGAHQRHSLTRSARIGNNINRFITVF
jgi:hypothetical protein